MGGEAFASPFGLGFARFELVLVDQSVEYCLLALALYSDLDGPPFSVFLVAVVESFVFHFILPWGCESEP